MFCVDYQKSNYVISKPKFAKITPCSLEKKLFFLFYFSKFAATKNVSALITSLFCLYINPTHGIYYR